MAKGTSKGSKASKSKGASGSKSGSSSDKSKSMASGKGSSGGHFFSKGASGGDRRSGHGSRSGTSVDNKGTTHTGSSVDKSNGVPSSPTKDQYESRNGPLHPGQVESHASTKDASPRLGYEDPAGNSAHLSSRNGETDEPGSGHSSPTKSSATSVTSDGALSPTSPKSSKSTDSSSSSISNFFNRLAKTQPKSTSQGKGEAGDSSDMNGSRKQGAMSDNKGNSSSPPLDVSVSVVNGDNSIATSTSPTESRGQRMLVSSPAYVPDSDGINMALGLPEPYHSSSVPPSPSPVYKPPLPAAAISQSYHSNKPENPAKYALIHSEPSSPYPIRPQGLADNLSRPGSSQSMATVVSPTDSASGRDRIKMTVGEIVQQIETKSANLLKHEDFTTTETLADLHFLVHQARYNSDMHIKRKLVSKMVEFGILDIFLKVRQSVLASDYLATLSTDTMDTSLEADNHSLTVDFTKEEAAEDIKDDPDTASISEADAFKKAHKEKRNVADSVKNFRAVITILGNITERSASLCEECIRKGFVNLLLTDLSDSRLGVPELKDINKSNIVKGYLGLLGDMVRFHSDGRELYRDAGAVKVLQHFLKSNLLFVKMRTVLILSYLINESENDIINSSDKSLSLLLKILQSAAEGENHYSRKYGYWAVEILAGLNRLAYFESNKERIVHRGGLSLYTRFLHPSSNEEEQLLASHGIWILAFLPQNKRLIREEPGCVQGLETLSRHGVREEIKKTAKGALWVALDKAIAYKSASMPVGACSRDLLQQATGHVLLSYQWSTKSLVHRIKERLKAAGFKVWMDIESTEDHQRASLETMSDAIDKSAVVLICMTQKYKDSPSCRTECEFAHRLKRDIIPLRLQPRYNPDGWLGKLVGTKLSFDFSRDENMETMLANLVRDLGNRGRIRPIEQPLDVGASRSTLWASQTSLVLQQPQQDSYNKIVLWTCEDVSRWLVENGLSSVRERLKQINGELLFEIRKMQHHAPEHFYATMKNDMGFDFVTVLKFTKALDRL